MESDQISDASVWRSSAADCVWAIYGDDYVVFHRPSGKTHFLNAAGHRLLTEILDRPDNERAYMLIALGYPADGCEVPDQVRKPLEDILTTY